MERDGMSKLITDILREMEGGQLVEDATVKWDKVIAAVRETRKAGSLTITLKADTTKGMVIEVTGSISGKVPEFGRPPSVFFVADDGSLVREDPRQPKLPLRAVADDTNEGAPRRVYD